MTPRPTRILLAGDVPVPWYQYRRLSSTMDTAGQFAQNDRNTWTMVSADIQTEGRGTRGRSWSAPDGKALQISLLIPTLEDNDIISEITLRASESAAAALRELSGLACDLKYPNDVMVGGKKIAGVLVESRSRGEHLSSLVLGMGINLSQTGKQFDLADLPDATSILLESGAVPDNESLMQHFLLHFMRNFDPEQDLIARCKAGAGPLT